MADDKGLVDIKIKIKGGKAVQALSWIDRAFFTKIFPRLQKEFQNRTRAGIDAAGAALPPYGTAYKAMKERIYKKDVNSPNYSLSGELFRSLTWRILAENRARLFFAGTRMMKQARGRMKLVKINGKMEKRLDTSEKGTIYRYTNQRLADQLAFRQGRGIWAMPGPVPTAPFIAADDHQGNWIMQEYERLVLKPRLAGLPPAISLADIDPRLRKFVELGRGVK